VPQGIPYRTGNPLDTCCREAHRSQHFQRGRRLSKGKQSRKVRRMSSHCAGCLPAVEMQNAVMGSETLGTGRTVVDRSPYRKNSLQSNDLTRLLAL